jgi:biopolymer transport protein ExbB
MAFMITIFNAMKLGGATIYPLSFLFIMALALIFDKIFFYKKMVFLPPVLRDLSDDLTKNFIESPNLSLQHLEELLISSAKNQNLKSGGRKNQNLSKNIYYNFLTIILENKDRPLWLLESKAVEAIKKIEKKTGQGLWILETIVTLAPLLGLLGTIIGMMGSFKLISEDSLLNPAGISGGVAQALIATAFGLTIAIFSLFAFNYFSQLQNQTLDRLEGFGTQIIDQIKLRR